MGRGVTVGVPCSAIAITAVIRTVKLGIARPCRGDFVNARERAAVVAPITCLIGESKIGIENLNAKLNLKRFAIAQDLSKRRENEDTNGPTQKATSASTDSRINNSHFVTRPAKGLHIGARDADVVVIRAVGWNSSHRLAVGVKSSTLALATVSTAVLLWRACPRLRDLNNASDIKLRRACILGQHTQNLLQIRRVGASKSPTDIFRARLVRIFVGVAGEIGESCSYYVGGSLPTLPNQAVDGLALLLGIGCHGYFVSNAVSYPR